MPRLSTDERNRAIGMLQAGARHGDVAARFGVSRVTISRLVGRYRTLGTVNDRYRYGRPRVTTPAQPLYEDVTST